MKLMMAVFNTYIAGGGGFQALYDHLMDFLADRGIDNTFADELMELSTAVEHQEYIKFLEDLQGFVKCN